MIGIYKIVSPSGKVYIGQSTNIIKRFHRYKTLDVATKNQPKLWNSLIKYGSYNHDYEIIEECTKISLNERERYWQDFYNCIKIGLNCILTETNTKSRVISEETKKRMSEWQLGDKSPKGMKGKKHTLETKQYISNIHKGKVFSKETKNKMSLAKKGMPLSEVHRQKLRGKRYSINGTVILNTQTGVFYDSIRQAAKAHNIVPGTLVARLSGRLHNNTYLIEA